jgi:glycerol-3-phosphate acyltransferase PlsX
VDVVVTDGFTGNVALKTGEGALKLVGDLLKRVFTAGPMARLGYVLARGGLKRLKEWLDPRKYNGAVLLGLNGVVVKSHGGADAEGFAHAVDVAMDMINNDFNDKIKVLLAAMDRAILASDLADANV